MANGLSAEQLKKQLYKRFESQGVLDDLRARLRSQLASELTIKRRDLSENLSFNDDQNNSNVPLMVANWLVIDHLRRQSYDWTISTFVAEFDSRAKSGIKFGGIAANSLGKQDVMELLKLNNDDINISNGILCELISLVSRLKVNDIRLKNISCQTETKNEDNDLTTMQSNVTVYDRLAHLEDQFREDRISHLPEQSGLDPKFYPSVVRGSDERYYYELCRRLETVYTDRLRSIQEKEQSLLRETGRQRKIIDEDSHNQKQKLTMEIDDIKNREQRTKERLEKREQNTRSQEIEINRRERELQIKEDDHERKSTSLESVISDRIHEFKQRFKRDLDTRSELITKQEENLERRYKDLDVRENRANEIERKYHESTKKIIELEIRFEHANKEIAKLNSDIAANQERLKLTADYEQLKTERFTLKQEIEMSNVRISAAAAERERQQRLICELSNKASEPSTTVVNLQREIASLREDRSCEEISAKDKIKRLELELESCKNELEEANLVYKKEIRRFHRTTSRLEDTKSALNQSQVALKNHLMTQTKIRNDDHTMMRDSYFDTSLRDTLPAELKLLQHKSTNQTRLFNDDFISKAKLRVQALEMEANNINRSYGSMWRSELASTRNLTEMPSLPTKMFDGNEINSDLKRVPIMIKKRSDENPLQVSDRIKRLPVERKANRDKKTSVKRSLFANNSSKQESDFDSGLSAKVKNKSSVGYLNVTSTPNPKDISTNQDQIAERLTAKLPAIFEVHGKAGDKTRSSESSSSVEHDNRVINTRKDIDPYQLTVVSLNRSEAENDRKPNVDVSDEKSDDRNVISSREDVRDVGKIDDSRKSIDVGDTSAVSDHSKSRVSAAIESEDGETLNSVEISAGNISDIPPSAGSDNDSGW